MGRRPLGGASSRASLGRSSMGPPGRWLAHAARPLGTRLTVESPRIGAGLDDQRNEDGDEQHADEFAAVLDRRICSKHAARGVADAEYRTQGPLNLPVYAEQ